MNCELENCSGVWNGDKKVFQFTPLTSFTLFLWSNFMAATVSWLKVRTDKQRRVRDCESTSAVASFYFYIHQKSSFNCFAFDGIVALDHSRIDTKEFLAIIAITIVIC